jgi:hypothetical protein
MRLKQLAVGLSLLALLGTPAFAKPKESKEPPLPKIVATGISEFDSVFMEAKGIHETIDNENTALKEARKGVNKAAGVAEDEPLNTALAAIKTAANGNISLDTSGDTPRVKATDGAPDDVQASCTAINKLLDAGEKSLGVGKTLEPQAKALGDTASEFPGKLADMGLDAGTLISASPKVATDVKATASTSDRVSRLIKTCEGIFTDVKAAFAE